LLAIDRRPAADQVRRGNLGIIFDVETAPRWLSFVLPNEGITIPRLMNVYRGLKLRY
jgi:hypothetical protein